MKQFIVDAFTDRLFSGNQAAVCLVEEWPDDELMLSLAKENNLSETAFLKKRTDGSYDIRWFTPASEIDFCGHATLGSSFVVFNYYEKEQSSIIFHTKYKGDFYIFRTDAGYKMVFPAFAFNEIPVTDEMEETFGVRPKAAYMDRDLLCVFEDADVIKHMKPSRDNLLTFKGTCIAVTAKGSGDYDCVSRVFAPELNIYEDPVTGSTHCMIAPYWSSILGKEIIRAYQASERGGELLCQVKADKVEITGKAVLFAVAELNI